MTSLFTYSKSLTSQGLLSGRYSQSQSISFPPIPGREYRIRIYQTTISSVIPNVYLYGNTDTTHFRLTGDGGATWTIITMTPGFYTVTQLNAAISNALIAEGLLLPANISDPPIYLGLNPVDQSCYIVTDTTKATVGTVQIGISFAGYNTGELIGFTTTSTIIVDGTFAADTIPLIDYQGSSIGIQTSLTGARWFNGTLSNLLASFPIPYINKGEIRYPSYDTSLLSPYITCDIPRVFTGMDIRIINMRNGKEIVFSYGDVNITFEIRSKAIYS